MVVLKYPELMYDTLIYASKDEFDLLVKMLQDVGAIHVVKYEEVPSRELEFLKTKISEIEDVRAKIEKLITLLGKPRLVEVREEVNAYALDKLYEEVVKKVDELYNRVLFNEEKVKEILGRIENLSSLLSILEVMYKTYGDIDVSLLHYTGRTICIRTIVAPLTMYPDLKKSLLEVAHIVDEVDAGNWKIIVVYVHSNLVTKLEDLVNRFKSKIIDLSSFSGKLSKVLNEISRTINELKRSVDKLTREVKDLVEYNVSDIALAKVVLDNMYDRLTALQVAYKSKYIALLRGWVPESTRDLLLKRIYEETKSAVARMNKVERFSPETLSEESSEKPPSRIENKGISKYFEILTKLYGMPNYNEWDPTGLITLFFPIFFGFMIGDAVYGILLLFITRFVLDKLVDNPESEGYKRFKGMLYASAVATIIAGILTSTYLGDFMKYVLHLNMEEYMSLRYKLAIIPDLISEKMFLAFALLLGLVHVNIAHALSLIKNLKLKQWWDAVNEIGLFIAEGFGIPYILAGMLGIVSLPSNVLSMLMYASIAGIVVIIIAKVKSAGGFGAIMWLFDLTGILGDVLSYARIAGVGLATYYLAMSFNQISDLVYGGISGLIPGVGGVIAGIILCIPVFIIGHALNIALSSLGAFVHSLRLFYVEFLPKFYSGDGVEFKPLKIRIERKVLLTPA